MKNKNKKLNCFLILIVALVLSSCGGGSNGGNFNNDEKNNNNHDIIDDGNNTPDIDEIVQAISIDEIVVGSCFAQRDGLDVNSVADKNCDEAHEFEVAGTTVFEQDENEEYPGETAIIANAYKACQINFEEYVGVSFWDSEFDIKTITPSSSTWAEGDREITCLIVDTEGKTLASSVRNTLR